MAAIPAHGTSTTEVSPDRPSPNLLDPESPVFVWSRPASLRSTNRSIRSNMVVREYHLTEPDTLCILSNSMRYVCLIFTLLLVASLISAIFNSLLGSSRGSASYCKRPEEAFSINVLCPSESMFFYYECCDIGPEMSNKCCSRIRVWLALVCAGLSTILGLVFTFLHYCCCCFRESGVKSHISHL